MDVSTGIMRREFKGTPMSHHRHLRENHCLTKLAMNTKGARRHPDPPLFANRSCGLNHVHQGRLGQKTREREVSDPVLLLAEIQTQWSTYYSCSISRTNPEPRTGSRNSSSVKYWCRSKSENKAGPKSPEQQKSEHRKLW